MKSYGLVLVMILLGLAGCDLQKTSYSQALFEHVPEDPELLLLVRPNELMAFTQKSIADMGLNHSVSEQWGLAMGDVDRYRKLMVDVFEALGLPWENIEVMGVMVFLGKPVFLAAGDVVREDLEARMRELGFRQNDFGAFNYLVDPYKLWIPDDGLIMMAEGDLLDFLQDIPDEHRLWFREDFREYREKSPLNNTLFVWSKPPERFLTDFPYRDELGSVSLAVDLKSAISIRNTIRLNAPDRTIVLYDILSGAVSLARGVFANDPVYGPIFHGIEVVHDNTKVDTSLVIPSDRVDQVRNRILADLENPQSQTLQGMQRFFETFK